MDRNASARTPEASADELTTVFARIQGMLLSEQDAAAAVEQLAEVALGFVHSAVGAGASLMDEAGHRTSTATTDRIAAAADALQYELGQGPCVSAWATTTVQRVDDTTTETRWGRWCAAAAGLGIRSVLSAPMVFKGTAIGALKVYSTSVDRFSAEDERRLVLLAGAAATLLGIAQGPEAPRRLSASLQVALADRKAVETATGMLMERHGWGHDTARARLLAASRAQRRPAAEIARALVARTTDPGLQVRQVDEDALGREQARLLRRAMDHAGLGLHEVWMHFFSIGGDVREFEVEAYLHHSLTLPGIQRDTLAHAVNELIDHGPVLHAPYTCDLADPGSDTDPTTQHETGDGDTPGQ